MCYWEQRKAAEVTESARSPHWCVSPDLDKITEEGDSAGVEGEGKATSKAKAQQRRVLPEGGGGGANDTKPESATGELCPAHFKLILQEFSKNFLENRIYTVHYIEP